MERLTLEVGSFGVNCSLLTVDGRTFVVDPGSEGDRLLSVMEKKGLVPEAILLTHAHFDHITGIAALQRACPELPVYVHPDDVVMFGHPFNQLPPEYPSIGTPANVRDAMTLGEILPEVAVIPTPGHTPGGVCYHVAQEKLLFSGDTLFAGSVGRTDFPGGSLTRLMASLRTLVTTLPEETLVIPGHGRFTTIRDEKNDNPYLA